MRSDTVVQGLERYRIGARIRTLRTGKGLGLAQLGKHTGLSAPLLSKIERGQLIPTLPTLLRIALVFGVGLEHFFAEDTRAPRVWVTRRNVRMRLPEPPDGNPAYLFESLDFPAPGRRLDAFYAEFPVSASASAVHRHTGAEFIYVMRGQLVLDVDGRETLLEEGDSVYFDSGVPHSYRREGRGACAAIVVVAPG